MIAKGGQAMQSIADKNPVAGGDNAPNAVSVRGLSQYFTQQRRGQQITNVLKDVNLDIKQGEFLAVVGASGCGKTTLLRIIDGLVTPSAGTIRIDARPVHGTSPERSMVFQEFNLLPWRSAAKNTEFGLELDIQKERRPQRAQLARENLAKVGLGSFNDYFPHQLSGGMKQRVGIARALSTAPKYLLMDEPFGALDPMIRELMQIELLKLLDSERRTIVFVTHSIEEAIFLSDRIVVFGARPGRIIEIIAVDLPKPRWQDDEKIKASPPFVALRNKIWRLLKAELQRTDPRAAAS
jgi:NitT/TauT family transport system ATP-binding protein